jgi:hypothetical protein
MKFDVVGSLTARMFAAAALLAGCGAPGGQLEEEQFEEMGQTQEELSAPTRGGTFGYGVTTGSSHIACPLNNSGAVCLVPQKKTHKWCVAGFRPSSSGGLSAAEYADLVLVTNGLTPARTGFTLTRGTDDGSQCVRDANAGTVDIFIISQGCPGRCSPTSSINACVCMFPRSDRVQLTESVAGSYFSFPGGSIHIDSVDIESSGMNAAEVRRHGIAKAILAIQGQGETTGILNLFTEKTASDARVHDAMTQGQLCQMKAYNPNNPTTWAYSGNCPQ